jgi:predicted ATPase with chaperone activity
MKDKKSFGDTAKHNLITETLVGMTIADLENLANEEGISIEGTQTPQPEHPKMVPITRQRLPDEPAFLPGSAPNIEATGLSWSFLEELVLKHLFHAGTMRGNEIAYNISLPSSITEEVVERLKKKQYVEISGSARSGIGRSQMIFRLTNAGLDSCKLAMERDLYSGPAPVPWNYYLQAVAAQSIRSNSFRKEDLQPYFTDLELPDSFYDAIGPAMNSGKSLFLHGPPGNGKTAICQRMTNCFGGDVFIPYAVIVDNYIIKIFDENLHKRSSTTEDPRLDQRWVRCKRPIAIVGGELKLEDLQLSYSSNVRYYEAPIQMKATNGMLLVDDFGRQKVSPTDLLNRWIVPLESEIDFVSLHTGKKLEIPFDLFVVFSTNLNPADLVDDAFLRRVRYKLEVTRPDVELFKKIFQSESERQDIEWNQELFDYMVKEHYTKANRPFNACEPRDLLAQIRDLSHYHGYHPTLSKENIDTVIKNYFVKF